MYIVYTCCAKFCSNNFYTYSYILLLSRQNTNIGWFLCNTDTVCLILLLLLHYNPTAAITWTATTATICFKSFLLFQVLLLTILQLQTTSRIIILQLLAQLFIPFSKLLQQLPMSTTLVLLYHHYFKKILMLLMQSLLLPWILILLFKSNMSILQQLSE